MWDLEEPILLEGLADFLARFAVEALLAPLEAFFGHDGPHDCLQGAPESAHGEPRKEIGQTAKPMKRWPSPL